MFSSSCRDTPTSQILMLSKSPLMTTLHDFMSPCSSLFSLWRYCRSKQSTLGASTAASIFLVNQSELIMYLKTSGYVQRHLFYVGSRKRLQAVLSPLLDKVIERLLSSVLHSEALGTIFGCGESTKTLMQEKWGTKLKRNDSGLWRMQTNCSTNTTNVASFKMCWLLYLTDNIRMFDSLQQFCLLIQALLVNHQLFGCTFTVDLLHSPRRCVHFLSSGNSLIISLCEMSLHYSV